VIGIIIGAYARKSASPVRGKRFGCCSHVVVGKGKKKNSRQRFTTDITWGLANRGGPPKSAMRKKYGKGYFRKWDAKARDPRRVLRVIAQQNSRRKNPLAQGLEGSTKRPLSVGLKKQGYGRGFLFIGTGNSIWGVKKECTRKQRRQTCMG